MARVSIRVLVMVHDGTSKDIMEWDGMGWYETARDGAWWDE